MKKLLTLISGEFYKLFHRKVFIVLLIIFLALSSLTPFTTTVVQAVMESINDGYFEYTQEQKEYLLEEIAVIDAEEEPEYLFHLKAICDTCDLATETGVLTADDVRYVLLDEYYYVKYLDHLLRVMSPTGEKHLAYLQTALEPLTLDYGYDFSPYIGTDDIYELNAEGLNLSGLKMYTTQILALLKSNVKNVTPKYFADRFYDAARTNRKAAEMNLAAISNDRYVTHYELETAKLEASLATTIETAYQKLAACEELYFNYDWHWSTIYLLEEACENRSYAVLRTEAEFEEWAGGAEYSYEAYKAETEASIALYDQLISRYLYSIEQDIPTTEAVSGDARVIWDRSVSGVLQMLGYLLIIFGALLVAEEFSSGTMRLLAIRPFVRWKIFAAKCITILVLLVAGAFYANILGFVSGALFTGGYNLFSPVIYSVGSYSFRLSVFVAMGYQTLLSLLPQIYLVSFAMAIAALTRITALGIALPFGLSAVAATANQIVSILGFFGIGSSLWYYTVFPHLELATYYALPTPVSSFTNIFYPTNQGSDPVLGIFILLVYTVLLFVAAVPVYHRRQITN